MVGSEVKALRSRLGITQEELAKGLKMSSSTLVSRENGKTQWKIDEMRYIVELAKQHGIAATLDNIFPAKIPT